MARRHWLDPLARRLLVASGQLPATSTTPPTSPASPCRDSAQADHQCEVERELLALKLRQEPARSLRTAEEVRHAAALGWRLDVNRASAGDWARLPGIDTGQVDLLLRLQAGGVQLSGAEDLQRLLDLPSAQLECWLPVLLFRWYGEPATPSPAEIRIDLNRAGPTQLERLGLSSERRQRLLRERARGPFRDLADLQQRLHLPPDLVEHWIGKVRFSAGQAGPELPPARRSA
jgi:DNA uptake protein ComE-like DNA-binding protein